MTCLDELGLYFTSQKKKLLITFLYGQSKMDTYSSFITVTPNEGKPMSRHFLFGDRLWRQDLYVF